MHVSPAPDEVQQPPVSAAPRFPIVGLGASAGGVEALTTFFAHMPPDTNMAFVVILHLAPDADSQLAAILQRHTTMPVQQVVEAVRLKPNHIYVLPPNEHLVIDDDTLRLSDAEPTDGIHMPIDHFFRTLAEAHTSHVAAIILSGTGSDGSIGIKRIKESGGVTLVQDPQDAEFDGMPRMAIGTGLVDFVLPVASLPDMLLAYWRRAAALTLPAANTERSTDDDVLRDIFALLRVRTGYDFSQYKRPTITRRLARRMQVTGETDLQGYLALLRSRPAEVQALLQDFLISVTNFFRDRSAWAGLEERLPLLFANKGPDDSVRVWVVACATGEEAYTIAMLLREYVDRLEYQPRIQVFATDIDDAAIAIARQGIYPASIAGDVSPARLQRFFVPEPGGYRIKEDVRDLVLFARHNVLHDPPFSRVDLITCRNLLIYLNHTAQEYVLHAFHFSLRPEGYLLLGSSESVDGTSSLFTISDKAQRMFQRRPGVSTSVVSVPRPSAPVDRHLAPVQRDRARPIGSFSELHQQLVAQFTPPSVIVNDQGDIVHLGRGVGQFLHFSEGEPSHNLLNVVQPDLRLDLRTTFFAARQHGLLSEARGIRVVVDGEARLVDVIVQPITEPEWARDYLLVLFQDVGAASTEATSLTHSTEMLVSQLEIELDRTKAQLRTTVEQYEAAVEEYKAANEELYAINEELRAATEELETSKEELQSINEELTTLNAELKHKVDEVTRAHSDLQNLIASTQIGTIFLDRELCLKRFTPSVQELFNVILSDIGRPLDHLTHTLRYDRLFQDAAEVIQTLATLSREVQSASGKWYMLRLLPYRTLEDRIDGVVLTFVDLTERKRAEEALRESEARFRAVADLVPDLLWSNDPRGYTDWLNQRWLAYTAQTVEEAQGYGWFNAIHPDDRERSLRNFQTAVDSGEPLRQEYRIRRTDGMYRWFLAQAEPVRDEQGTIVQWFGAATDIHRERTALAEAEAALQTRDQFLSIASHELRTPLTALMGYAGMLPLAIERRKGDPVRMSEMILRQTQRLNRLIEHLLDVSRLQQGQFAIKRGPVDLSALVAQYVDEFRATLPQDASHNIELYAPAAPVLINGDAERLEEVLHNLLTNAVKYSPQGGIIYTRVMPAATEAILEIADQGIGIPADAQSHLFEPFYRAHNVGPNSSGFGLGLHIVREIVQRHGGRIEIESAEGKGSTFRVALPLLGHGTA